MTPRDSYEPERPTIPPLTLIIVCLLGLTLWLIAGYLLLAIWRMA